jgi:hypothetical protein
VQSRGVRHGSAEVLARLGRGDDVDASEWLNKGIFVGVAGRGQRHVIYETYLVA